MRYFEDWCGFQHENKIVVKWEFYMMMAGTSTLALIDL